VKHRIIALSLAGFIAILDQATKAWVSHARPDLRIIPGFFNIHYIENTGAAFGILQGKLTLLTLVSVLAMIVIVGLIFYERDAHRGMLYALACILGGTCGNLIDRVRLKYVVDFLQVYIKLFGKHFYWPSFNIADSAISIGVVILIFVMFRQEYLAKKSSEIRET
jgi:signal peptidase II